MNPNTQSLRLAIRVAYVRELWQEYLRVTEDPQSCCTQCLTGTADCDVNPLQRAAPPTREELALKLFHYEECP